MRSSISSLKSTIYSSLIRKRASTRRSRLGLIGSDLPWNTMVTVPGRFQKVLKPSNSEQPTSRQHKEEKSRQSSKHRWLNRSKTVSCNFVAFYDFLADDAYSDDVFEFLPSSKSLGPPYSIQLNIAFSLLYLLLKRTLQKISYLFII